MKRSGWGLRLGRFVVVSAAVLGMALFAGACGSDDDDDSGDPRCTDGCNKANSLCDFGSEGLSECLQECNAATEEQKQAAEACINAASTCNEATACRP